MLNRLMIDDDRESKLQHRRITLSDGRYLIFYTFGETQPALAYPDTTAERLESTPQPETKEELNV